MDNIHGLFEQRALQYPHRIAVKCGTHTISYAALNAAANQFANYLTQQGVGPGQFVPILADKSIAAIIAILGTLKAGAAYVPINAEATDATVMNILKEINPRVICVDKALINRVATHKSKTCILDNLSHTVSGFSTSFHPSFKPSSNHNAYLIFTSGTTGKPKGVVVQHKNLIPTFTSWQSVYQLTSQDIHLQMASFAFDVFSGDLFRALGSGAKIVLCPKKTLINPKQLYELINKEHINVAEFVPAILRILIDYCELKRLSLSQFRILVVGSDSIFMHEILKTKTFCGVDTRLFNSYGVTEGSIDSGYKEIGSNDINLKDTMLVPVGKPFPHVKLHVLDEKLKPVKQNQIGELYIGGAGVAAGYYNQPALTAESFIKDPNSQTSEIIYRTGDLAQLLSDGNIAFLGRNETLIKIDGKRVDVPSVEATIDSHPKISKSILMPVHDSHKPSIRCFVLLKEAITHEELYLFLVEKIPEYSIPKEFFIIDELALSLNSKIDRAAIAKKTDKPLAKRIKAPSSQREKELVDIWKKILRTSDIGTDHYFCQLGGSSLLYAAMLAQVNKRYGTSLTADLKLGTIECLAKYINTLPENHIPERHIMKEIIIVGGGPAAVSLLIQLIKKFQEYNCPEPTLIRVIEKGSEVGPGLPYSNKDNVYILNLPKDMMEPIYGELGNFTRWLDTIESAPKNTDYPPRYYFGDYLKYLASKTQKQAKRSGITIEYHVNSEVLDISATDENQYSVKTQDREYTADYVCLCTGHMPSSNYTKYLTHPTYFHDPWSSKTQVIKSEEDVLIAGTRLSAIDSVLKLTSTGHKGKITLVSRSGLLPTVLAKSIPSYSLQYLTLPELQNITQSGMEYLKLETLMDLFWKEISKAQGRPVSFSTITKSYKDESPVEWLEREIETSKSGSKHWQQVLFAMYPIVPNIWSMLSMSDKKIFLKQYQSLFLTYLAAFPLENATKILSLIKEGRISVRGGLEQIEAVENGFKAEFVDTPDLVAKYLINATGHGYNPSTPLFSKLVQKKLITKHHFGGINVNPQTMQVIDNSNNNRKGLFAAGELTRGTCLATTDMIRVALQTGRIATGITQSLLIKNNVRNKAVTNLSIPTSIFGLVKDPNEYRYIRKQSKLISQFSSLIGKSNKKAQTAITLTAAAATGVSTFLTPKRT